MEDAEKQHTNRFDWLKAYQFQKGQSGNPAGRPPGKTLKEFAREFLANMSDEDRIAFFQSIEPKEVWKMAEGTAPQSIDHTSKGEKIVIPLLDRGLPENDSSKETTEAQ